MLQKYLPLRQEAGRGSGLASSAWHIPPSGATGIRKSRSAHSCNFLGRVDRLFVFSSLCGMEALILVPGEMIAERDR
jgi:hypothetical protein